MLSKKSRGIRLTPAIMSFAQRMEDSVARTDREALRGPADKAMKVVEHRFGEATAIGAETGSRIETDPFAHRFAQQIDGQVQIDKTVAGKIKNCADTIARIGGDSNAPIHARFLVVQQRVAQAEPDRHSPHACQRTGRWLPANRLAAAGRTVMGGRADHRAASRRSHVGPLP